MSVSLNIRNSFTSDRFSPGLDRKDSRSIEIGGMIEAVIYGVLFDALDSFGLILKIYLLIAAPF
jgi:hypothetical protein